MSGATALISSMSEALFRELMFGEAADDTDPLRAGVIPLGALACPSLCKRAHAVPAQFHVVV